MSHLFMPELKVTDINNADSFIVTTVSFAQWEVSQQLLPYLWT